ncbi:hypothetical protein V2A60_002470 [Cordyceps javanica]
MAKSALLDGGEPGQRDSASLRDMINTCTGKYPDRPAVLSPMQPPNLYARLTEHRGSEQKHPGSLYQCFLKRAADPWYHVSSYALSWVLPPPPPPGKADFLVWSFGELQRASLCMGQYLRDCGVRSGSTAVCLLPVSAEWALVMSTCALNGYVIATLDHKLLDAENLDSLQELIYELCPSLFVVATVREVTAVAALKNRQMASGICLARLPPTHPAGWVSLHDIAESEPAGGPATASAPCDAESTAMIVYTSGTSGKPKGCAIKSSMLVQSLSAISGVPLLPCTGTVISGSAAQSRCPFLLLGIWASGNSAALNAAATPNGETLLLTMQATRPVSISLLIGQLSAIYSSPKQTKDATRSIRVVVLIGSTITQASVKRAGEVFSNATIQTGFGMTEAANVTTWKSKVPRADKFPAWNGIAASGTIAPGSKVKIVDGNGAICRRNEIGELHLGGRSVISGYLGGTRANLFYGEDSDRWYICGDSALVDDGGYLYVVGRTDSIFKRDGTTVISASVENLLEMQFTKSVVAVTDITLKDGERGLFAVFQTIVPCSCEEINQVVSKTIGRSHRLDGVASLAELGFNRWPTSIAGKIGYSALKAAAEKSLHARLTCSILPV